MPPTARMADALPIWVIADLWSRQTREPIETLEKCLIEAARENFSRENARGFYLKLMQSRDRGLLECEAEASLLRGWPGLHTRELTGMISRDSLVSRADLAIWCDRTGRPRPRFWFGRGAATAKARADCRRWLVRRVSEGARSHSKRKIYQEAHALIPGLSRRAFDEVWRATVPPAWRRPLRPRGAVARRPGRPGPPEEGR